MEVKSLNKNIQFLAGGGEMGKLTREKDWGKTYLGPPQTWPQSLRTTLSIILNSKFPMFLFWGNELTCFYNDAYRPSLGREGKHPSILGMRGEDAWPEIWDIIKPLIDRVLAGGEATWSEDQLIPIFRNGKIEDVYWTFSYSPVNDESGRPAGVFVTCTESTEKINLLKELENSNDELAFAIEATELGTWDYNPLTNKFSANKRLKKWFGLMSYSEIELHHAVKAIAAEDRARVTAAIQKALDNSSGGNYDIEYTIIDPVSKTERIVHAKGRAWFNDDNKPCRFNGTLEDVTEQTIARRKFENLFKEIEQHREKLNIVINASELATWELNLKTGEVHYSEKYLGIMGYESGTALTHPEILKHLHPDDLPVREKAFEDAFSNGILSYETRIIWNDGSLHWAEVRGKVFYDEDGGPSHLIGTVRDITNEKDLTNKMEKLVEERTKELTRSNESLKKSEQRYHLMVEEVQDYAILYLNREGIVENWNTGAEKIKGFKAEEIIGKSFYNFYTKEDRQNNLPQVLLKKAAEKGRAGQEGWRVRKDGTYFWASVVITAVHDENGNVIGFSKVTHDLTDKKNTDDALKKNAWELEQKNIELEKMNKELQSFAYVSSHDLQEPLRKIQTFASRILEKENENLSEQGKELFNRMQGSAKRMQALINDLLAYSRTHTSERILEETDLTKIVAQVKLELKEELQQKQAILEINELCPVRIVKFQFQQLLYNLISNSLKFSRPGHPPLIKIKSEIVEGTSKGNPALASGTKYCHISVSDNGIGFDQQYNEKIFELFQRLHGRMEYPGTGIGLAIVKKIVENHNGIITARAELNKGTTFDIYLPAT